MRQLVSGHNIYTVKQFITGGPNFVRVVFDVRSLGLKTPREVAVVHLFEHCLCNQVRMALLEQGAFTAWASNGLIQVEAIDRIGKLDIFLPNFVEEIRTQMCDLSEEVFTQERKRMQDEYARRNYDVSDSLYEATLDARYPTKMFNLSLEKQAAFEITFTEVQECAKAISNLPKFLFISLGRTLGWWGKYSLVRRLKAINLGGFIPLPILPFPTVMEQRGNTLSVECPTMDPNRVGLMLSWPIGGSSAPVTEWAVHSLLLNAVFLSSGLLSQNLKKIGLYSIDAATVVNWDKGIMVVEFETEISLVDSVLKITEQALQDITTKELSANVLAIFKQDLVHSFTTRWQDPTAQLWIVANHVVERNNSPSLEQIVSIIQSVNGVDILDMAQKVFIKDCMQTTLAFHPSRKDSLDEIQNDIANFRY